MKILIVHCDYQYSGGEDTVVNEESRLLQEHGHQVQLLRFTNMGNQLMKVLQMPFNVSSYKKMSREIEKYRPDVVHIHNMHFGASPSILYAIKRKKVPVLMTLHNYRLLCPSATLFHNGKPFHDSLDKHFYWSAIEKAVYKNSKLLTMWLACSMQLHKWLKTWQLPNRYIVLTPHARKLFLSSHLHLSERQLIIKPNFSSEPRLSPGEKRENHFLYIGRLSEEKGIEMLLKTFASSSLRLKIAGDGPLRSLVEDYANRNAHITYAGSIKKDRIYEELQQCTALVFPSIWYEGMPLTIIEAFSCATPVIASRLGAMQHMIRHNYNGLHFEAGSETDLRRNIEEWDAMTEAGKSLFRTNAKQTYQDLYTPEKNAEELTAVYNAVLADAW